MSFLSGKYHFTGNEKWTLGAMVFAGIYILSISIFPSAGFVWRCPWHEFLGMECPGCGITRAALSLIHLKPLQAVLFNPLIILVLPYVLYRFFSIAAGVFTGKVLVRGWPAWFLKSYQYLFIGGVFILGVIRYIDWIRPIFS